jgi:CheY-like chemotaxis protein
MTLTREKVRIFLVEDDEGDVRITREAFEDGKLLVDLEIYETADQTLKELERGNLPDLILLDLNLPGMDGRELLAKIKENPKYKSIPIVVLTTSKSEEDIIRSYKLHCNAYITKPVDPVQFITVARSIESFWFEVVKLPLQATRSEVENAVEFRTGQREEREA